MKNKFRDSKATSPYLVIKILIGLLVFASLLILFNYFAMPQINYQKALKQIQNGHYAAAIETFTRLGAYKDSRARLVPLYRMLNSQASVGATVYFGAYEQDDDLTNWKEKIAWRVLAQQDGRLLLVSKAILESLPYNLEDKAISWQTCSLRAWLNQDFLSTAFTEEEQKAILPSRGDEEKMVSGENPVTTAEDKLFLLSVAEASRYFASDADRKAPNTPYALSRNAFNSPEGNGWYWLRTPGQEANLAAAVNYSGTLDPYGNPVYSLGGGVRPALWISQTDLQFLP